MDRITLSQEGLKLWQENQMESRRYNYPDIKPEDLVVDIGAYRGEFAEAIQQKYNCNVICFEPTSHIRGMKENVKTKIVNAAAGDHYGKINMGGDYLYTSIFTEEGSQQYDCVELARELDPWTEIALCKINIEGSEYNLLHHIVDSCLIQKIKNLQVQFHYVEGLDCEKYYQILSFGLSVTHRLSWRVPFVWENWVKK